MPDIRLETLMLELVHEFIEKIVVSAPEYKDGKRYRKVDIYYNSVGIIREFTPEEMKEYFKNTSAKAFLKGKNGMANGCGYSNEQLSLICGSIGILEDIKMLMNYGYDSLNCFTLILCGEPHLNSTLKKPVHEALRQRITVHYNFSGLSDSEVAQYVLHKIACAGGSASIMEQAALSSVHSHSIRRPTNFL